MAPTEQPAINPQDQGREPKGVTVGEPEFQDEEIEIPAEEGSTPAAEAVEPAETREKKRRGPKRYATLTHERDQARSYADEIRAELDRERAARIAAETKADESSKVAMQSFAAKSETDLKQARAEYQAATESGDAARITEAAEQLASAKQTADDVKAWENTEKNKPAPVAQQQPQPQRQQTQPVIQDLPEPVKNWVMQDHNRYWDPNSRDASGRVLTDRGGRPLPNPEFDQEMHVEATMFATKLERQIASGKRAYKVNSPEYYRDIEDHMAKEFPDYFGGEEEEEDAAPPPKPRASPVASPSRSASPAGQNGASTKVRLTADQIRFVQKQVDNNGGPKYPSGHPKQFKPMSFEDAKVSFARRLQTQAREK